MNLREILVMGNPRLVQRSHEVLDIDSEVLNIIQMMKVIMKEKNGVGIAAPQIGFMKRIIIYGFNKNSRYPSEEPVTETVLINPKFEPIGDNKELGMEGCLSVPGLRGMVSRYSHIKYEGYSSQGKKLQAEAKGFHARIIQHEIDHLDGILFPFKIDDIKTGFAYESVLFDS